MQSCKYTDKKKKTEKLTMDPEYGPHTTYPHEREILVSRALQR